MKKIELTSRKFLRKIFNGISLTAVAFIFQACYGPGPDMLCDFKLSGTVTSKTTDMPIQGIKITVDEGYNFGITDKNGNFQFYANVLDCQTLKDGVHINFLDIDGIENGHFADQTVFVEQVQKNEYIINVVLDEIQ